MKKESKIKSNKITCIVIFILVIGIIVSGSTILLINKSKKELINNVNNYLENELPEEEKYMIMRWDSTEHLVRKNGDYYEEIYKFNDEHTSNNFVGIYNNDIYFSKINGNRNYNFYSLSLENFEKSVLIDNLKDKFTFKCYSNDKSFEIECSEQDLYRVYIRPDFMVGSKIYIKYQDYKLMMIDLKNIDKIEDITEYYTNASNLSFYTNDKFFNESGGIIYEFDLNTKRTQPIVNTKSSNPYFMYNNEYVIYSEDVKQGKVSDYKYLTIVNTITKEKIRVAETKIHTGSVIGQNEKMTIENKLYYMSLDNSIVYEYDIFNKSKREYFNFGDSSKYNHINISTNENGIITVDRYYYSEEKKDWFADTTYLYNGKEATEKDLKIKIKMLDGSIIEKTFVRIVNDREIISEYLYK